MRGVILALLLLGISQAVDRSKFKSCIHSGFCQRHRAVKNATGYKVESDSVKFNATALNAIIKNEDNKLSVAIVALEDSSLRVFIDETGTPLRARYQPLDALTGEPKQQKLKKTEKEEESAFIETADGHKAVLHFSPFYIDIYSKRKLVLSINSRELLKFEHFRKGRKIKKDGEGFWEESFGDSRDLKPYGSSSVGVDIDLIGFRYAFGIPEHAEGLSLRNTVGYEPYRLYNLDVFEYDISSPMALYGSIPYLTAVNPDRSIGVLWLNSAETWVDVDTTTADKGRHGSIVGTDELPASRISQVNTRVFSETGAVDILVFLGPRPYDVVRQFTSLTGVYPLPPIFSLGYHQSRWNYKDDKDVKEVSEKFFEKEIPLDVIWLDIEHTDQKKYFTWDKEFFPNPIEMIELLKEKGRKLVNIVDPHIKKDTKYSVYTEFGREKLFVKDSDGKTDYVGNCWPGDSKYVDFFNPRARELWAQQFALEKYNGTTNDVYIWNDMNEPSVFSGPEVTMHKDAVHHGGLEHREVHNMYGFYQHQATWNGLKERSENSLRPFVLTRSFFIGSQRTAAVWTGDNTADWNHLKYSIPMLLTLSIGGIPHVGADVGGFFKDPDEELLVRWYQASAFQPFFRAHSHQDSKRREPYLFSENTTSLIRDAIRRRYELLPYWYTLFYEHSIKGLPVMRPLYLEFPDDESGYDEDREWMVGSALLVKPITEPGLKTVSLYLPGRREVWYEWDTSKARPSPGAVQIPADISRIPVFQKGGTIIPVKEGAKHSSGQMKDDAVTLYIALNSKGDFANGTVYLDDEESYDYKDGDYAYWSINFKREHDYLHTITNKIIDKKGTHDSTIHIEKIVIRGAKFYPRTAHIFLDDFTPEPLEFDYDRDNFLCVIKEPNAFLTSEFRIDLHT